MRTSRVRARVDRWWTAPEINAAGRMGLFRILYCVFFLWHLSYVYGEVLGRVPEAGWRPVWLLDEFFSRPPAWLPGIWESLLVGALVLLLLGRWVRWTTLLVLVLGTGLDAFHQCFWKVEHSTVFLSFYIPLFAFLGGWGGTYSLDALLQRRSGGSPPDASDHSWPHALAMRAVLVMLALLFLTAAFIKLEPWASRPMAMSYLLMAKNSVAAIGELPLNPVGPFIAQHPILYEPLRFVILAFEGTFFLALFSRRLRSWFCATALLFHAVNALFLVVTFTPLLIVYGLFVDWQALFSRTPLARRPLFVERISTPILTGGSVLIAAAVALAWNQGTLLRDVVNLGGLLDWRTAWVPVVPVALVWWCTSSVTLVKTVVLRRKARNTAPPGLG